MQYVIESYVSRFMQCSFSRKQLWILVAHHVVCIIRRDESLAMAVVVTVEHSEVLVLSCFFLVADSFDTYTTSRACS